MAYLISPQKNLFPDMGNKPQDKSCVGLNSTGYIKKCKRFALSDSRYALGCWVT